MSTKKSSKSAGDGTQSDKPTKAEPESTPKKPAPADWSDPGYEDLLREIARDARFTPEERALTRRVKEMVRATPGMFVEAGALLDGRLFRGAPQTGDESKRMTYAVQSLERLMPEMCELDLDELKRESRLRRAAGITLVHWLLSDPDASEVEPPPSVLANAPWDGVGLGLRTHVRDSVFTGMLHSEQMATVPNPLRARWILTVRSAVDELLEVEGSSLSPEPKAKFQAGPSVDRAARELEPYDRPKPLSQNAKRIARVLVQLGEGCGLSKKELLLKSGVAKGSFRLAMLPLKEQWGVQSAKDGGYHIRSSADIDRLRRAVEADP